MAARNITWKGTSTTNASTTDGDYEAADNFEPVSIRNPVYRWLASGSGTSNYYLDLAGGGNPGLVQPSNVQYNSSGSIRTNLTAGTAGSLAAGAWGYGDADALGYSTIYVRTVDSVDPDTKSLDFLTFTDTPKATDHVRIPPTAAAAITGVDKSSIALGDFIVEDGCTRAIGSVSKPLVIDPDRFEFAGIGISYINLHTAAIAPRIFNTGKASSTGTRALNLYGTALTTIDIVNGDVGLASQAGETMTASTVRVVGSGAKVTIGKGATVTTLRVQAGEAIVRTNITTFNQYGGLVTTQETMTIGTATQENGTFIGNSSGTITTFNGSGGTADFSKSGAARTITTFKQNPRHTMIYDPAVLTITNRSAPDSPVKLTATAI